MTEKLGEMIMRFCVGYSRHLADCNKTQVQNTFDKVIKTAKDCNQDNVKCTATGVKCSCGYSCKLNAIKKQMSKEIFCDV